MKNKTDVEKLAKNVEKVINKELRDIEIKVDVIDSILPGSCSTSVGVSHGNYFYRLSRAGLEGSSDITKIYSNSYNAFFTMLTLSVPFCLEIESKDTVNTIACDVSTMIKHILGEDIPYKKIIKVEK